MLRAFRGGGGGGGSDGWRLDFLPNDLRKGEEEGRGGNVSPLKQVTWREQGSHAHSLTSIPASFTCTPVMEKHWELHTPAETFLQWESHEHQHVIHVSASVSMRPSVVSRQSVGFSPESLH